MGNYMKQCSIVLGAVPGTAWSLFISFFNLLGRWRDEWDLGCWCSVLLLYGLGSTSDNHHGGNENTGCLPVPLGHLLALLSPVLGSKYLP